MFVSYSFPDIGNRDNYHLIDTNFEVNKPIHPYIEYWQPFITEYCNRFFTIEYIAAQCARAIVSAKIEKPYLIVGGIMGCQNIIVKNILGIAQLRLFKTHRDIKLNQFTIIV